MRNFLVAVVLCGPSLASADPTPAAASNAVVTDDCAQARKHGKTCVIDMGKGDDITSDRPTDEGHRIDIIKFGYESSLVRIRWDFINEILKTAEDL